MELIKKLNLITRIKNNIIVRTFIQKDLTKSIN